MKKRNILTSCSVSCNEIGSSNPDNSETKHLWKWDNMTTTLLHYEDSVLVKNYFGLEAKNKARQVIWGNDC